MLLFGQVVQQNNSMFRITNVFLSNANNIQGWGRKTGLNGISWDSPGLQNVVMPTMTNDIKIDFAIKEGQ